MRFEYDSHYDETAYQALSDVTFKLFREPLMRTHTYPFLIALSAAACLLLISVVIKPDPNPKYLAACIGMIVLFIGTIPLSRIVSRRRFLKKALKQIKKDGPFPFTVHFRFYEDGIEAKFHDVISIISYDKMDGIAAYKDWHFLFFGQGAYMIENASFPNEGEKKAFLSFIRNKSGLE